MALPSHPSEMGLQLPGKGTLSSTFHTTMLQLWEPNTALSSPHKFSNLSWLLTRGAFWNTEPILLPLARGLPEPCLQGVGRDHPVLALFLLICPQLIAVQLLERGQEPADSPLQLVLLPSSSDCTSVPSKTDCTYCIVCLLWERT